jgi:transcriptional regulator with XRE-family HTH domain
LKQPLAGSVSDALLVIRGRRPVSETSQLIAALKKVLKAQGVTYHDIADRLRLSEASVKRIFAAEALSLDRLEEICRFLDLSIYELARLARAGEFDDVTVLTEVQEQALAQNPQQLACFYLLLNGWTLARVARRLDLSEPQLTRLLAALDKLKLIELHPRSRVRLLTPRTVLWRKGGPIRRMYEREVKAEFLEADFERGGAVMRFETGELSDGSVGILMRKIDGLAREFENLADLDISLTPDRKRAVGLLVVLRPWVFSLFSGSRIRQGDR